MRTGNIGTVSHGTLRNEDLLKAFALELNWICANEIQTHESRLIAKADSVTDYDSDEASEIVQELFNALDNHAPENCYFGAHEGDASDFGFWSWDD